MDFRIFRAFLNFLQLFFRTEASTQAPLKFFLWLQKHCSKHLGASTTSGLYNARRIKVIGCLEKKERNENEARLNSTDFMDFRIFRAFLNFLQLFLRTKASTQAPLKFFLWLQKPCSKYLEASTTSGLYNARRIKVIGCLEKKERNENSDVRKYHSQQRIRAVLTQTSLID